MISYEKTNSFSDALLALDMLRNLSEYYPEFVFWYLNRVIPGVVTGEDVMIVAREHGQIVGVALGKRHEDETKLRCIRVAPSHQKRNIWRPLIDMTLRALDCAKPVCTVPYELLDHFSRIFINHYEFDVTGVDRGAFRFGCNEYRFNDKVRVKTGRSPSIFIPYGECEKINEKSLFI